jgi:hypothetical protein
MTIPQLGRRNWDGEKKTPPQTKIASAANWDSAVGGGGKGPGARGILGRLSALVTPIVRRQDSGTFLITTCSKDTTCSYAKRF